jgi:molybdopterin biosynthesis enzyme
MRLTSIAEALAPALAAVRPAPRRLLPVAQAIGLRIVAPVRAPSDCPVRAAALRSGLAVRSLDLAGASGHAPILLAAAPKAVRCGEALPDGCDAVIDPDAVTAAGRFVEIAESVEPGAFARLAGHDLRAGEILAPAGALVGPELALACAAAGVAAIDIVAPGVRLELMEGPERSWLAARLAALGCAVVAAEDAGMVLRQAAEDAPPRLALRPGEQAWVDVEGGLPVVMLPARFDGLVGAFAALALPLLARLSGTIVAGRPAVLARKLSSAVGTAEVALLRIAGTSAEPLATGDITLSQLARADAFAVVPPGSEGYAPGETIAVTPFDAMLDGAPT